VGLLIYNQEVVHSPGQVAIKLLLLGSMVTVCRQLNPLSM